MTASQVKEALAELKDGFSDLLGRRRTGVIAALLAAASRLKTAQVMTSTTHHTTHDSSLTCKGSTPFLPGLHISRHTLFSGLLHTSECSVLQNNGRRWTHARRFRVV